MMGLTFFISLMSQLFLRKTLIQIKFCCDTTDVSKPQAFHTQIVPRAGGVGITLAFVVSALLLTKDNRLSLFPALVLCALPVFAAGILEDAYSTLTPKKRLFFQTISAILIIILLKAIITDVGFFKLPYIIAIPFTMLAIVGMTNAINIIDGLNGLASGIAIIVLIAFAVVSKIHGDILLLKGIMVLLMSILGFFVVNYPKGLIFLGDGGSYFIGFMLAVFSILLVRRNPDVSPWFPLVCLSYPVFDTLFAIYRRRLKGLPPFSPDRLHLHSLLYKRLIRSNPCTTLFLLTYQSAFILLAIFTRKNSPLLLILFIAFCASYLTIYKRMVKIWAPSSINIKK